MSCGIYSYYFRRQSFVGGIWYGRKQIFAEHRSVDLFFTASDGVVNKFGVTVKMYSIVFGSKSFLKSKCGQWRKCI